MGFLSRAVAAASGQRCGHGADLSPTGERGHQPSGAQDPQPHGLGLRFDEGDPALDPGPQAGRAPLNFGLHQRPGAHMAQHPPLAHLPQPGDARVHRH